MKTDKAIMAASLVGTIIVGVVLSYAKRESVSRQRIGRTSAKR